MSLFPYGRIAYALILFPLLILPACSLLPSKAKTEVIAEVNKNQLLASDIISLIPAGLPREDSLSILRQYINTWALSHLMESKALRELPKEQRDVSQALEEYRRALLVFRYEKKFVETRIDTAITSEDIIKTYHDNQILFTLSEPIAKLRYVKISLSSPYLEMVRSLYRSTSTEDIYRLQEMAHNSADKYDTYNNQWISASAISKEVPVSTEEVIRSMERGFLDCNDNIFAYFVAFSDLIPSQAVGPIEYQEASIRNIILGRRKQDLLKNLEKEVLEEGWKTKQLKVYFNSNE